MKSLETCYKIWERDGIKFIDIEVPSIVETDVIDAINNAIDEEITQGSRNIVLCFNVVSFMSSRMIGILVMHHKRLEKIGGKLVLCNLKDSLIRIFKILSLDKLLFFAKDIEGAMLLLE